MKKFKYLSFYAGLILLLCSNYAFAQRQGGANLDPSINGQNVGMAVEQSAQSIFKWEQIADKSWKCTNTTAQRDQGTFTETRRDQWSVFLTSDKTSRKFQIDLYQKKVYDRSTGLETAGDITQVGLKPSNGESSPNPPTQGWAAFNPGDGYFFITNVGNNKVVDVARSSTNVNTNVGVYGKHGGKNQKFKFISKGNGYYAIETALKQNIFFSIHNSGKADNTNIKLNNPVGSQQHFKIEKNGAGEIRMTAKLANDLYLGSNDSDNNLVVRKGNQGKKILFKLTATTVENTNTSSPNPPTQGWAAFNPGDGYFFITNVGNNKVVDVARSSTNVNTNVGVYGKHGGKNQKFKFVSKGNGYYAIETALKQNIFFSIHASGKADNTNIKLNNPVGPQQHFKIEKNGAGEIRMTAKLANDLYLGSNDSGNNLVVRKGDQGKKILFKLTPTTVSNSGNGNNAPVATTGKIKMINTAKTFVVTITKVGDDEFEKVIGPNRSIQVTAKIGDVFTFSTNSDGFEALPYTVSKVGGTHRIVVGERYTSGKGNKLPNVKANRHSFDIKKVDPIFIDYTKAQPIQNVKGKTVGYGGMRKEIFEPLKNQDIDWNNQDGDYATKNHFSYNLLMEMNASTETKMFYSASAYQESFSANVGADTPKGGGSASFSHTSSNSSSETNIYSYSRTKVRAYSVKLKKDHIALTNDFKKAVKALPKTYNKGAYQKFISQWGTHYPVSTTYGGVQVAAYKFNAKEVMESESMAIGVEGNVKAASVGGGYSNASEHKQVQENSQGMYRAKGGTGIGENFSVDMSNSVPVEINLKRLHELLLAQYFNDGTTDAELSSRKTNLKRAITEYVGSATDNGKSLKPRMYKISDIQWKVTKDDDLEVYGSVSFKVLKGNKTLVSKKPWSRNDSDGSRVNTKHGTVEKIPGGATIAVTAENGAVDPSKYSFELSADLKDDVWDGDEKIGKRSKPINFKDVNATGYQRLSFTLSDGDGKVEVSAKVEEIKLGFDD